ncbi:LacI family DNA-binding transcriptional regulator [Amycolatopsis cihanbeyliensis]|uniref:LacI family DNA-binding transcriptional regulator n=1 Tax=Amycolatopsis cihanbeyliensis TaxID=1128664 RepID=UPI001FEC373B|nr:LacI family DNA-binding transcriptional regulator [Amycolatopsis cihanbeyliensis]
MAVTIADVARRAGTSAAVVSYVLNDGPRPVAEHTRARVLAAVRELGYRRNRAAAALRSGRSGLVGLVLPDTTNPYFAALGRYLETALIGAGKLTVTANSDYDAPRQSLAVDMLLTAQVEGVVVVSAGGPADPVARALAAGTPAVYVHHRPPGSDAPLIAGDNGAAIAAAVAHLREHGHTEIAFLAGPTDHGPVGERVAAWCAATGATEPLRCAYTRAAAAELFASLARDGRVPRALVAATDEQAIGLLAAAYADGIRIPDRLAVISCDGSPDASFTAPPLTVTRQPLRAMAERAVAILGGAGSPADPADPLPADLAVGRSCGCSSPSPDDHGDREQLQQPVAGMDRGELRGNPLVEHGAGEQHEGEADPQDEPE